MTVEGQIKNLAKNFVDSIHKSIAVRKAILDAFEAFEPEAIGLEALAFETELPAAVVVDAVSEMVNRHEVLVHIEDFIVLRDGTDINHVAFPADDSFLSMCKAVTMYRINKEWEAQ